MTSAYPFWRLPVTGTCLPVCSSPAVRAFSRGSVRRSRGAVVQSLPVALGTRLLIRATRSWERVVPRTRSWVSVAAAAPIELAARLGAAGGGEGRGGGAGAAG